MIKRTATLCLTIAVLLGSAEESFSQTFAYRCVDTTNFQKNFIIDTFKRTIIHRSSFNPETNKKFNGNESYKKIVNSSAFCSGDNNIISDNYKITKNEKIAIIPPIGGG